MNAKPSIYTVGCAAALIAFAVLCATRAEAQTAAATAATVLATPADIVESLKFNAAKSP